MESSHGDAERLLAATSLGNSTSAHYDLHVAATWYLYCIGCDLLTKVQRTSWTKRISVLSELWFRSINRPLLRITYCTKCARPLADIIADAAWTNNLVNRSIIEESKLWSRVMEEQGGSIAPESAAGSYFIVENPSSIILSREFAYKVTDYGRDYCTGESRYPVLLGRDTGRFHTLAWVDELSEDHGC